jgi:hypothetical protein
MKSNPFSLISKIMVVGVMSISPPSGVAQSSTATSTTFQAPQSISDQDSQGMLLGDTNTDLVGFYGGATLPQPGSQAVVAGAVTGSQAAALLTQPNNGLIVKYQCAPQVNAFNGSTTTEQTTTVSSGSAGASSGVQTSSVIFVNKPTVQAGLGIAGYRVSAAGTININYLNSCATSTITPTQEAYDVVEIKAGPLVTSAVLSPAICPLNTTNEQIFNITGNACVPGTIAIVNKPTAQAGLGYCGIARVVGVNQVGITFSAISSGAVTTGITPTAAETWNMAFLPQLNAYNPTLVYTIPAGQASATASTSVEQTSSVTGILVTDTVTGISKPALQAGTVIAGGRVMSSGVIGISLVQPGVAVTPLSSETYRMTIQRQVPLNPMMIYSGGFTPTAVAATSTVEVTSAVAGVIASSSVLCVKPSVTPGILVANVRQVASSATAGAVAIQYQNLTTTSITPPTETYTVGNVQLQGPGTGAVSTAGLSVEQTYYPAAQQSMVMANALRSALVALNLISGV